MNKNIILAFVAVIALSTGLLFYFYPRDITTMIPPTQTPISVPVLYKNTEYGFTFVLPDTWRGYSIIQTTWQGITSISTATSSGPKMLMRNPKWTTSAPYEDLPVLVFTIAQWNEYIAEKFAISAAPIQATELARNNVYVFALPPRWDFDYSLECKEAQEIIAGKPLHAFDIRAVAVPQDKLNTDFVCEQSTSYMKFIDIESRDTFITDCKAGKHPEVIEKYKANLNLGAGVEM